MPVAFGSSSLVEIETAFGASAASVNTTFELKSVTSIGAVWTHATWTHPANNRHYIYTGPITDAAALDGRTVYIQCTEGGTNASGYTASLKWQI